MPDVSYGPVDNLSDREAMQIIVALKYWTRATSYKATPQEQEALVACDDKAGMLWKAGAAVGGIAGFGLTSLGVKNKVPLIQRFAVSGAFASGGSFYGVFRSNKFCLNTILGLSETVRFGEDLEQHGSVASPLAAQAKQILLDGPAATARNLKADIEAGQRGSVRMERPSPPRRPEQNAMHAPPPPSLPSSSDDVSSIAHAGSAFAHDFDRAEPSAALQPAMRPNKDVAPSGVDSWEAVRERYRARKAGEQQQPSFAPAEPQNDPFHEAHQAAPVRTRRNQYGDEVGH